MINQLSWKIGGQQGEGVESTDRIFSTALNRLGYYLYGYRHFSSRIKGGHTNNKIRISTNAIRSISDDLDILVAFDQESILFSAHELNTHSIVVADSKFMPELPANLPDGIKLFSVPFTEIAEEVGSAQMKNMVAAGASWSLLGLSLEVFEKAVEKEFDRKGADVVTKNIEAVHKGAEALLKLAGGPIESLKLAPANGKQKMFIIGNDAVALGAVAAGCRFMAAYPITPATEILEYLTKTLPKFGGAILQTEDEIAAITMAIGANYGGARCMTSSSGPGLSLMMEAIGLAGMTETPVVIVDAQRGGPSTGLPTKQEQSDFMSLIYGTHGEVPKIVIAPVTIEDCFYDMIEAFNLAEKYQVPVIVATDLQLALGKQSSELLDYNQINIDRGKLIPIDAELPPLTAGDNEQFKRYEFTEDNISPRPIPGTKNGLHHVTGVEHSENGRPSELVLNRKKMMDKRFDKMANIQIKDAIRAVSPHKDADLLIVGVNSTAGTIAEAASRFPNLKINQMMVRQIHPFPTDLVKREADSAKKVLVVENNITGQIAALIKMNLHDSEKIKSLLKYNGNPFLPSDIETAIKELI